ncbi:MAG TPA: NAD(P)-dependent glycerol-1-phosphate dehydrogenase [Thermoplasmatales archaeon]|nr:NAD(P)-dependent glycerol-1-phosphate dehydrogenase [Thermoplasmatales archaeon]
MPFKKAKLMEFPRNVIVGHKVLEDIGALCDRINLEGKCLVVHDEITKKIAGEKVVSLMSKEYEVEDIVVEKATVSEVRRVQRKAKKISADFLIAVGGGSVIDVAKLSSYRNKLPFISVPTAASHDGIASPRASIKENGTSVSKEARSPLAILADTTIISKAPYRMLASGCADVISNLTAILDWQMASRLKGEYYSSFAAALAKTAAELLIENAKFIKPGIEEGVWIAVKSMIVSGVAMSVANSSRPASGAEHMFSHALDKISPGSAMHGEQCGVGAIMMMYLHGGDWEEIRDALKEIGAPTTAKELGVTKKNIIKALTIANKMRPKRYTILGADGLTKEAAERLVKITGVV